MANLDYANWSQSMFPNQLTTNYPKHQAVAQHPCDHDQEEGNGPENIQIAPWECWAWDKDN